MCGVFGFVSHTGRETPNIETLKRIAEATEARGRHAWGMAWIDGQGVIKSYKQTGPIGNSLGLLRMAADARVLIGHCRYATQGDYRANANNHPHPADGGWFVHNGMIPNYRQLVREHSLFPSSECDSEVLGLLIERMKGKLTDRVEASVAQVRSDSEANQPLVLLGLWKPGRLIAVRRGNPLSLSETKRGTYLASLPECLPGRAEEFPDNKLIEFA